MPPTILIANHEAGHAVAAWHFGRALESITITPQNDEGRTRTAKIGRETPETIEQTIIICLAGGWAEDRCETQSPSMNIHPLGDIVKARNLVGEMLNRNCGEASVNHDERIEQELARLIAETGNLLDTPQHRKAIDAVAKALLDQHELTGDEATKIIANAVRER